MEPILSKISEIIPDEKIDKELSNLRPARGPRQDLKASQMYRVHLLLCIKRLISFRQLHSELTYQQGWRKFARLKNQQSVPSLRAMSCFRQGAIELLRKINEQYVHMIFSIIPMPRQIIAVPDSTDIRAATKGYLKKVVTAHNHVITHALTQQQMLIKAIARKNRGNQNGLWATRNIHYEFCF